MDKEFQEEIKQKFTTKNAIRAIILGIATLILAQAIGSVVYLLPLPKGAISVIFTVLYIAISYGSIRLCCIKILHVSMDECFIVMPNVKMIWLIIAILLPLTVSAVLLCTSGEFVNNNVITSQAANIIINSIFVAGLASGVVEEMVFRGMIMKALEKRWGKIVAIIIPSVTFALMHVIGRDLNIIDILMLLVAGTSVGIMFSLIVYESGSVWPSALVHGTWNVIMVGKILDISVSHHEDAILSYKLYSKSFVMTGGAFEVESSIVATLGYIFVIALTLFLITRKVKVRAGLASRARNITSE